MRYVLALLVLVCSPVFAQGTATLSCTAPDDAAGVRFFRAVSSGGPYSPIGESSSCSYVDDGLAPGTYFWVAAAINADGLLSDYSNEASKTIAGPDSGSRITSTRIEGAEWTCRDSGGAILTSHTRQDKAIESCANLALSSPGVVYEIRPSGYRIVAE